MSPPAPCTVQVPLLSDSLPVKLGLPISAQVHPTGQLVVGVGLGVGVGVAGVEVMFTLANMTGANDAECEAMASPAKTVPLMVSVTDVPAMGVQFIPSGEVAAVNVFPLRAA